MKRKRRCAENEDGLEQETDDIESARSRLKIETPRGFPNDKRTGGVHFEAFNDPGQLDASGKSFSSKAWAERDFGGPLPFRRTTSEERIRIAKRFQAGNADNSRVAGSEPDRNRASGRLGQESLKARFYLVDNK